MPDDEIVFDVTGQPNGPSPEEQATVDAEQAELIAQIKAEREPIERAERIAMSERLERAQQMDAERRSVVERLKQLEARVALLERK